MRSNERAKISDIQQDGFINFRRKVCLITGAGSPNGIGFATAKIMGDLGAEVALIATTERVFEREKELLDMGVVAKGYIGDLMDRRQVKELVDKILKDFGGIQVLVNNAGMTQVGQGEDFSYFLDTSHESWDLDINRNLNIPYNVTRQVLPIMVERGYGRIVNVSSVTGPLVSNPGEAGYSAGKAGIIGMSKAIAIEVGGLGITINNVLPGWISTESQTEEEAQAGKNTPLKRSAHPQEVANAIVFLASKEASYITGESLVVDGGNTIQEYKGPSNLYY
ncbi:MAG: SDR family NAD(P)-dependent oxidoreductase [Anaerovoracaceae bacterium]|jgi:3-oxoacyl-[acyl-carrier protein] reductase|nr:SDR family NAD(P)-dependent oxidoreductase [Anaerovoracaceae bacterium]